MNTLLHNSTSAQQSLESVMHMSKIVEKSAEEIAKVCPLGLVICSGIIPHGVFNLLLC